MGSQSDYSVMKDCVKILKLLKVKYKTLIVSAHRTPKRMFQFAETSEKNGYGVKGLDSLMSMAQMPKGVPVGCLAIDCAFNAGILAASIIGNFDTKVKSNLERWRRQQTQSIKKKPK